MRVEQVSLDDLKKTLEDLNEVEQLVLCKAIAKLDKAQEAKRQGQLGRDPSMPRVKKKEAEVSE